VKGAGEWLGSLAASLRLIPDQFTEPCAANPDAVIELAADGSVITMTPTGGETGVSNNSLSIELLLANGARLG
jgi:Uma2 family endonuclease